MLRVAVILNLAGARKVRSLNACVLIHRGILVLKY